MGQAKSLQFIKEKSFSENVRNKGGQRQLSDLCVRKCGMIKLSDKLFQFILHLENQKYYKLQYQQQDDGSFLKLKHGQIFENLIVQQCYQQIMNDKLRLQEVLSHYEQSADPKSFLSKIIEDRFFDFDAIQVQVDLQEEEQSNQEQKFTQVYKVSDEQQQLIFFQSRNFYVLVKLNPTKIMKTNQQYVCSHSYKLRNPFNYKEINEQILKFNNVDDLIEAIKQ